MFTFVHIIWLLVPLPFFLLALWSKLEALSKVQHKDNPMDMVKQGVFVLLCSFISIGIDKYVLPGVYASMLEGWVPYGLLQFLLLPFVLYTMSAIVGPTKDIIITKAPRPTDRKKGHK